MVSYMKRIIMIAVLIFISGCTTTSSNTLYQELGGEKKIAEIVDHFIEEIAFNPVIFEYFKETNIDRFREKMNEHVCVLVEGPCNYTGDTMTNVHSGMNIPESDFNVVVDLFYNAMDKADIPHSLQNRVIRNMAPLRGEVIYL